jgi:hypothetical protein
MGKAEELAAAVEGLEGSKGKRRKYPMELRQRLVEFVREQRADGKHLKSIAPRVGVSPTLLHRWEMKRGGPFRRVEVQRPPATSSRYVLRGRTVFASRISVSRSW